MAQVRIPAANRTITDGAELTAFLAQYGIDYERWTRLTRSRQAFPPTPCSPRTPARSIRSKRGADT